MFNTIVLDGLALVPKESLPSCTLSWCVPRRRVTIYSSLEKVLQRDTKGLDRSLVRRIIHLASRHMRETQSLSQVLEVAYDFQIPLPDGKLENICLAVHNQQVMSILALSAKGHLDLTLSTLEDLGAAMSKMQVSGIVSLLLQDLDLKLTLIQSVTEISCAIQDADGSQFTYKEELLGYMLVPDILGTIFIRMPTIQEGSGRGFLLEGGSTLAGFYLEAVTSSLLSKPLPMDRQTRTSLFGCPGTSVSHSTWLGAWFSMENLACVISKGFGERVAASLCKQGTWPLLQSLETHCEGVCQLARALLPLGIVTPSFIGQVLKWVKAGSQNLRVTGTAFLSQLV
ncbi:hypothetical protein Y1Q_0010128 [Alligator mississippiensis]|uniref:Maestro-like HEAT-repeats domain-containing protein n=1 Tax=Alligator mississippiensis TaxID=8496 RepID=A0A151NFT0_ALLMI|nr:hypothetical protein Y1Q_0010128 [Alligator mississippiensis]